MTVAVPEQAVAHGPLNGVRVIEFAGVAGQFCGKLMADLGADVIKVEPPDGDDARRVGPFYEDVVDSDRSLFYWYYNTSKRGVTLDLTSVAGVHAARALVTDADVVIESFAPGYLQSVELDFASFAVSHPGLVMCAISPFGQSGPWRDYRSTDLGHLAAGGQMASCGYDAADAPGNMPIAPGGGNAWHIAGHYAYMAIMAALVYRSMSSEGQYIDFAVHEACALTTEAAITAYIYRDEVLKRQTGRHHGVTVSPRTQFESNDGRYVTALIANQLNPKFVTRLAAFFDENDWPHDLHDDSYADAAYVDANAQHIIEDLVGGYIGAHTAEEVYHQGQAVGFTWGAVRPAEALFDDPHLHDRKFWKTVVHPELGRSFTYPGEAAIYSASPWNIANRAPLLGEHNNQILQQELGLDEQQMLMASGRRS